MPRLLLLPLLVAVVAAGIAMWRWLARKREFEALSEIELLRGLAKREPSPYAQPDGLTHDALYPERPPLRRCACGAVYRVSEIDEQSPHARLPMARRERGQCMRCLLRWEAAERDAEVTRIEQSRKWPALRDGGRVA